MGSVPRQVPLLTDQRTASVRYAPPRADVVRLEIPSLRPRWSDECSDVYVAMREAGGASRTPIEMIRDQRVVEATRRYLAGAMDRRSYLESLRYLVLKQSSYRPYTAAQAAWRDWAMHAAWSVPNV